MELHDATGTVLLGTTTTDENGNYYFDNLNATARDLRGEGGGQQLRTGGVLQGQDNTVDPDGGNNSQSSVHLTTGTPVNLAQDFGYRANSQRRAASATWSGTT